MRESGLIRRALAARPARAGGTSLGVAACVLLVLVLFSVSRGLTSGVSSFVGQEGADVWVAPRGSDNLIRNSGLLPLAAVGWLDSLPGVARADPVLRGFVTVSTRSDPGTRLNLLAIAYRTPDGIGGPPRLERGRRPRAAGEVTLDRAAAWRLGVHPSDSVLLNGWPFLVVGLSDRTNLIATQFLFVSRSAASRLGVPPGSASFVALEARPGTLPDELATRVSERDSGLVGLPRAAFVENNVREVASGFRPMQRLLSLLGVAIAAMFVGLLVHAAVEDRRREVAILLAMGAPSSRAAVGILSHVVALVAAGGIVGSVLALVLAGLLREAVPTLELVPRAADAVIILPTFLLVGLVAAAMPLARLRRVEPVEAFRP